LGKETKMSGIRKSKSTEVALLTALAVTVVLGVLVLTGMLLFSIESIERADSEGAAISASVGASVKAS